MTPGDDDPMAGWLKNKDDVKDGGDGGCDEG